jgi:hypothetical protein
VTKRALLTGAPFFFSGGTVAARGVGSVLGGPSLPYVRWRVLKPYSWELGSGGHPRADVRRSAEKCQKLTQVWHIPRHLWRRS